MSRAEFGRSLRALTAHGPSRDDSLRISSLQGREVVRPATHIGCRASSQSVGQVGTTLVVYGVNDPGYKNLQSSLAAFFGPSWDPQSSPAPQDSLSSSSSARGWLSLQGARTEKSTATRVARPSSGCSVAPFAMWWRRGNPDHRTPSSTLTPGFMEAVSTSIYAQCAEPCYGDGPLVSVVISLVGKSLSSWRSLGSRVGVQRGFHDVYDGANHNDRGRW